MLNRRRFMQQLSGGVAAIAGSAMFPAGRVLGPNDRIRFALIGAGGRGMDIFKAALRVPNTQAVAAADVYSRRLDEVKGMVPAIQTYTDFRRLLDDKSIDAVLIATPQHQHALNFVPAIQAGKDIYQEKTMAFNPDHARRMRSALQGSDRVVQVGVQSVSGKAFAQARELSTPDRLGTISAVHTHHYRNAPYGGWKRTIPPDCNLEHVGWKEFEGEAAPHDSIRSASSIGVFSGTIPAETFLKIWSTRSRFGTRCCTSTFPDASPWQALIISPRTWKSPIRCPSPWISRKICYSPGTRCSETTITVKTAMI